MFVYSSLLALALTVSAPWWLWRMATSGRYRAGLRGRLGRLPTALDDALRQRDAAAGLIWVHAVSVGEVLAVRQLIGQLQAARPDTLLVLSTTTATGQKVAAEKLGIPVFYFPLDFAFAVRRYMRALRPSLLVLVEGELWPRLLHECRLARVPVAVVNARVSDRSFRRSKKVQRLWARMAARVDLFLAQGRESADRLHALGAQHVAVTGNLKYDAQPLKTALVSQLARMFGGRTIVVAGSTLPGEEALLLEAWTQVRHAEGNALLIIAPRHPERFEQVASLVASCEPAVMRASQVGSAPATDVRILLLDTLGDLAGTYALADVAFIGGSLVGRGGHNPLEAARFGVPVLMGPSYENFREIVDAMIAANAIRIVYPPQLAESIIGLLRHGQPMGDRGRSFFEGEAGATKRTVDALLELLP